MSPDCVFCKIVAKTIPAYIVYEDEYTMAFLDIFPRNPGHVQVIPKDHARWVWDIPNIGNFMETVQKVACAQKKALNTDFVIGLVAGEEVPHAHFWLVPRFEHDGHGGSLSAGLVKKINAEEMQSIAERIRTALE